MNKSKLLIQIGGVLIGISIIVLLYGFFSMYGLAGKCLNGVEHCHEYTVWQWVNRAGMLLSGMGTGILLAGVLQRRRTRK